MNFKYYSIWTVRLPVSLPRLPCHVTPLPTEVSPFVNPDNSELQEKVLLPRVSLKVGSLGL